jgi:predicted AAA+ superfamily ATPase
MNPLLERFNLHNQHWEGLDRFKNHDPQLKRLEGLPYLYKSPLLAEIPTEISGIYLLDGGRQVGKSTLLKQLMQGVLEKGQFPADHILFLTGEIIRNQDDLRRTLEVFLNGKNGRILILLDEVGYIKDWDRAIKYLADAGRFDQASVILTGSNSVIIKDAMKRFPGRRGKADQVNFHYYPLSFAEFVNLRNKTVPDSKGLFKEFSVYLKTGGYLTTINELALHGKIGNATLATYQEWILGDFLDFNKSETYLRQILKGILSRYGSTYSWNALSKELSIDHHKTVSDYCELLSQMDAVYILSALREDKLAAAPKKNKKIYFSDPFIFHAAYHYVNQTASAWNEGICDIDLSAFVSALVEGVVANHFRRYYPTYYLKAEQEVDVVYVKNRKIFPVEVKWTNQLRWDELKYLKKYESPRIAAKVEQQQSLNGLEVIPIPELLLNLHR